MSPKNSSTHSRPLDGGPLDGGPLDGGPFDGGSFGGRRLAGRQVDYGYWAIIGFAVAVACWLLLMPWVPAIASATMHRFHLRTRSFVLWAIQQPIPAMYNFSNRYEVRDVPPDLYDPLFATSEKRYLNHFPTRILTFANTRYRYLSEGGDRWVMIDSSYRGQTIESTYHARQRPDGGFDMILLETVGGP